MRIAIIGGGATGVGLAAHLARALPARAAEILVVEPNEILGRGLAYSTDDPRHLLNVRVGNMSVFADQPEHLLRWLERFGAPYGVASSTPFSFISRGAYGAYVADLARGLLSSGAIRHIRARCVDLVEVDDSATLRLDTGCELAVDRVALATGNDAKPVLAGLPAEQPWTEAAFVGVDAFDPVLIVGTGLTMIDMALSLDRRGHRGNIVALSRRGLLNSAHRPVAPRSLAAEAVPFGAELSALTAWLRDLAERMEREGLDWRSAVDVLRPHTPRLWRSMSLEQKRRFLRHARPYWDVHRHRMAPEVERRIAALRAAGRLEIVAGRLVGAERRADGIVVRIVRRDRRGEEVRRFARVVDCTGLADDPLRSPNPLIGALLRRGAARLDPLGIGLDVAESYALIDAAGRSSPCVSAVGPLARAAFWESVAIPDIRLQCRDLAEALAKRFAEATRSSVSRRRPTGRDRARSHAPPVERSLPQEI
jgi:uncharacterized NAD(P)/FAD-binding protein YdhS